MTGVCLQVRLDSRRLPEKALIKIEDLTIIEHAMRALSGVHSDLLLLLTTDACVSRLAPLADKWGFTIFAGSKDNVLKRFICAAEKYDISTVIRATGDNPLVSASMANEVLSEHRILKADYTNWTDAPLGTGIEIVETAALVRASTETVKEYDLEHVTPWVYNNPDVFRLNIHRVPLKYYFPDKVSVDTAADLEKMKRIFFSLYKKRPIELEELISYMKRDILLIASTKEGNGSGHMKRMLSLAREIKGNVFFYISDSHRNRLSSLLCEIDESHIINTLNDASRFSKIVLDTRSLDKDLYDKYLKGLNIIAIDEGGALRGKIPYLIDILPLPASYSKANVNSLSFLDLPEKKDVLKNGKILVTFGGEDPAGLTELVCKLICNSLENSLSKIDIVLGPLYKGVEPDSRFRIIRSPSSLHNILPLYSGVITSFGITAFEANALDIPVLLINPTDYHEELGEISHFTSAGVRSIHRSLITSFLDNPSSIDLVEMEKTHTDLGAYIDNLEEIIPQCPICGERDLAVVERFENRSYCRCSLCKMLFMLNFDRDKTIYNEDYFFTQYENQYGKTYLDDFEHLSRLAQNRIDLIGKNNLQNKTILDVGCAYGPFLKQAQNNGLIPFGTDISRDAVLYVKRELGFPVISCEFDSFVIPDAWDIKKFDIITMWYVIEHFPDLSSILRKVNSLLKMGGIFSFSTPNGSGISSKKNFREFLFHSPEDHYTIWEPRYSLDILDLYGFNIVRKKVTGHHPERFPSFLSKYIIGRKLLNLFSHASGLGDTFEIYASKVREL